MDEGFPTVSAPAVESDSFRLFNNPRKARGPAPSRLNAFDAPVQPAPPATKDNGDKDDADQPEKRKVRPGSYEHLGLNLPICAALRQAGYNFTTPIQRKVIPPVLAGDDVVAMARTGSGKTAAFLAPVLHRLTDEATRPSTATAARRNGPRALIVAPTRELVLQELKFCRLYSKRLPRPPRTAVVVGGTPLEAQFEALAVCPEIIFATPGRLLQLLAEMGARRALTLSTVETLVLDEADRLFEGTLAVETARLLDALRDRRTEDLSARQTVLVSATMPLALAEFSRTGLRPCLSVVRLDAERVISPTLAVSFLSTRGDVEKDAALTVVARRTLQADKTAIVFAATHKRVEYLTDLLGETLSTAVTCVHGNMDQLARQEAVHTFRKGRASILIVTDVAARGIDLPELDVVVNYDIAATPKLFVHRVGRAGRAGRFGLAFNLVTAEELAYMLDVYLFIGRSVQFAQRQGDEEEAMNAFTSNAFAMESTFKLGTLPKSIIDEEVELVRRSNDGVDLNKAYTSARNAHKLYTKTRGVASGESVRRAKELPILEDGSRRTFQVHPWFTDMETASDRAATQHASKLSSWRPKESAVQVPPRILARVAAKSAEREAKEDGDDEIMGNAEPSVGRKVQDISVLGDAASAKKTKLSARQAAIEEERRKFYLPSRQDPNQQRTQKALRVKSGGAMGDDLSAYREIKDAAMDVNADGNADLLRSKHTGGTTAKYWDRVSKKYVKGGPSSATSKRNLHVATREAKAKAASGTSYATDDGELFKKWLSKNRKAVEQLNEQVNTGGEGEGGPSFNSRSGLGGNDFRKGAFGRKARVAAAAKAKQHGMMQDGDKGGRLKPELKTAEVIRKERKMKAKAEARRAGHKKGGAKNKKTQQMASKQPGSGKIRVIVRGKRK